MPKVKKGKDEIMYLLTKAIEKYKLETGQEIVQNTNRKSYESLAMVLSDISNQLPVRFEEWGTDNYTAEINQTGKEYPYRKYDITGGQFKDALIGIVSNPRPFFIDACYVYLYGIGRKKFEQNPVDENLLEKPGELKNENSQLLEERQLALEKQLSIVESKNKKKGNIITAVSFVTTAACLGIIALSILYFNAKRDWETVKKDMNIIPYQPSKLEIDNLEGFWLCYTGSPQARVSDPTRYHKVVPNIVEVKYKDGYFVFNRFGASFNHVGYMQFESPGIVSVFSHIKNNSNKIESPRHSLLNLQSNNKFLVAVSASWNFDIGEKNKIIGIREIYTKLGKGGTIEEVINEVENASCQCKIIRWTQLNKEVKTFYLKNVLLDSLHSLAIQPLIDERSILLSLPEEGLIISKDSAK